MDQGQRPDNLVVICHYNARSELPLDYLLGQLQTIPAGAPFDVRVVVNQARDVPVELASRYPNVEFRYRENTGMNLGAWDYGWRTEPRYGFYVFLQEECLILRPNWLHAYLKAATRRGGSAVGELILRFNQPWDRWNISLSPDDPWSPQSLLKFFAEHSVDPLDDATHIQALIVAASREILEAANGFIIGRGSNECAGSEMAFTKKVLSNGYSITQPATTPFEYIIHPQWMGERYQCRTLPRRAKVMAREFIPEPIQGLIRRLRNPSGR